VAVLLMSIALSATIRPSLLLAIIQLAMSAVLLSTSWWLLQSVDPLGFPFSLHHVLAVICAIASFALIVQPLRRRTALRIDVTGLGQIRLGETLPNAEAGSTPRSDALGEVVQLRQGSTLWPSLMVLRLQAVSGRLTTLILLPDSLSDDAFRALSVACRWIAVSQANHDALSKDTSPWVG
jgi:hypothetical protein